MPETTNPAGNSRVGDDSPSRRCCRSPDRCHRAKGTRGTNPGSLGVRSIVAMPLERRRASRMAKDPEHAEHVANGPHRTRPPSACAGPSPSRASSNALKIPTSAGESRALTARSDARGSSDRGLTPRPRASLAWLLDFGDRGVGPRRGVGKAKAVRFATAHRPPIRRKSRQRERFGGLRAHPRLSPRLVRIVAASRIPMRN